LTGYAAGADDAHNLGAVVFKAHHVRYQQQQKTASHADSLPARLTVLQTVLLRNTERVVKDLRSFLEPDAALALVGCCPWRTSPSYTHYRDKKSQSRFGNHGAGNSWYRDRTRLAVAVFSAGMDVAYWA
jgi:hypothetical protein